MGLRFQERGDIVTFFTSFEPFFLMFIEPDNMSMIRIYIENYVDILNFKTYKGRRFQLSFVIEFL